MKRATSRKAAVLVTGTGVMLNLVAWVALNVAASGPTPTEAIGVAPHVRDVSSANEERVPDHRPVQVNPIAASIPPQRPRLSQPTDEVPHDERSPEDREHADGSFPDLDLALAAERLDAEWSEAVDKRVRGVLAVDADVEVLETRCGQTFCRVRLRKLIDSRLDWAAVDRLLYGVATGETVFRAVPDDDHSNGHLYFSADDAHLPLDGSELARDPRGV